MSESFFAAIRNGNMDVVCSMLQKKPELLYSTAKTPKKEAGQSALQIAIRNKQFEVANMLLDLGADVNFMEAEICSNSWRMPVIQDAIMCAVMLTRWNVIQEDGSIEVFHSIQEADSAYRILERMFDLGADMTCIDSYGNSCLMRATLSTRQILPRFVDTTGEQWNDRVITTELRTDLNRIFNLLFAHGANCMEVDRNTGMPLLTLYEREPVAEFLQLGNY